ncbi:MAG: polysaccharide deacetylase family protein, partial [Verrucomicrobiota bacterium]|nr:polysaccharide deacetylase family protein [Verrucomicrobiota bacterium]
MAEHPPENYFGESSDPSAPPPASHPGGDSPTYIPPRPPPASSTSQEDEEALRDTPMGAPISFRKVMEDEGYSNPMDNPEPSLTPPPAMSSSTEWARPQPVQHDRNLRSWLYFLAGICIIIALWIPLRAIYQRSRYRPDVVGIRDADSFIALAYGGISAGKVQGAEEVSRFTFSQHIKVLRENGFNPIGLKDVHDFYHEGKLLPRKAVLISMEQSKKNSYLETRDILRQNRWKAVMFVRGDSIVSRDASALRWPILRDMALSGTWDVGAESMNGFRRIPSGPEGETGNFFSSPMWIAEEQRLETPEEFSQRIREEHEKTVAVFQSEMGFAPLAFAYPYGDYGQYDPRAIFTRVSNMDEVADHYGVGFSLGPFMLNTKYSDPRALNRLLVNPDWTPEQFLSIMESGRAIQSWDVADPLAPNRWLTDWGQVEYPENGSMWIKAIPRGFRPSSNAPPMNPTTGALSWMIGSDLFANFTVRIRFSVEAGQFGIRLRSRSGGEEGIRILFDTDGNCWVNQKVFGAPEFVHAAVQSLSAKPGLDRVLTVSLLGRTLFATLDGHMLLKEPLDLMGSDTPGLFGFEVWDSEPGIAATRISSLEFPRAGRFLVEWSADEAYTSTYLMKKLNEDAFRWGVISPQWLDAMRAIPLVLPKWDDETIQTFAAMRAIPVLPRITLRSAELALQILPELPAVDGKAMGVDGVNLDCRLVPHEDIPTLVPWLQSVHNS